MQCILNDGSCENYIKHIFSQSNHANKPKGCQKSANSHNLTMAHD